MSSLLEHLILVLSPFSFLVKHDCTRDSLFMMHECFNEEYECFFTAMIRLLYWVVSHTTWILWNAPEVCWWLLLVHIFKRLCRPSLPVHLFETFSWWSILFGPKPWNLYPDEASRAYNGFVLDDLWRLCSIIAIPGIVSTLVDIPVYVKQVATLTREYVDENMDMAISFPDSFVQSYMPTLPGSRSDAITKQLKASENKSKPVIKTEPKAKEREKTINEVAYKAIFKPSNRRRNPLLTNPRNSSGAPELAHVRFQG